MSLYEQIAQDHQSSSYSGPNNKWAGCTCGTDFTWETRENEHDAHVIAEFEKALRKQIAADIRAEKDRLIREDAATHLTFSGALEYAARIAEEGPLE